MSYRRLSVWTQRLITPVLPALVLTVSACGTDFDSIAQVEQLRVLAVQKSLPYAKPGDSVQLEMMYYDGASERPRDLEIMWLSGCENPPADLYELCFETIGAALQDADPSSMGDVPGLDEDASLNEALRLGVEAGVARVELGGSAALGFQRTFDLPMPKDIIRRRPPPPDPKMPPYGLQYVFFAICGGELRLDSQAEGFPIRCVDEDEQPLGAEDFVVGYSAVYAYEELTNDNPAIIGIEVDGEELDEDQFCVGSECEILQPDPERGCDSGDPTIRACGDEESDDCPELPLKVIVDEDSVNQDGVLSATRGSRVEEQMWVNYHADRGKFTFDVALVNDVATGFNAEPETDFVAPEEKGPAQIWAVVRDNRGGAQWARFQVCVE